jgi:hypothetical protein
MRQHPTPRATPSIADGLDLLSRCKTACRAAAYGELVGHTKDHHSPVWVGRWIPGDVGRSKIVIICPAALDRKETQAAVTAFALRAAKVLAVQHFERTTVFHFNVAGATPVIDSTDAAGNPTRISFDVFDTARSIARCHAAQYGGM